MEQRIEEFFASGTIGAEDGKQTLKAVVARMNEGGWLINQIIPLSFHPGLGGQNMHVSRGVLLCSKSRT